MKKKIIGLVVLMFFVMVSFSFAIEAPTENFKFKVDGAKKPVVTMNHSVHSKIECVYCHHKMKKDDTTVKKCSDCHKKDKCKTDAPDIKTVMHKNCKNCHKDLKKKKEKAGPTKCSKCHIK